MRLPQPPEPRRGRIEIIPMIDAIFFLLVYFMMTSLSLTQMQTHGVALPRSRTASVKAEKRTVVSVTKSGALYLDADRVTEKELVRRVRARVAADPSAYVVLTGDRDGDAALLLRAFDLVKQADAGRVVFATSPAPAASPVAKSP
jgi:biopolymer transport protein ExbD